MADLLWLKFTMDDDAYRVLMDTGDKRIVEAMGHPFWAYGLDYEKALVTNPKYWGGKNVLGQMMEDLRRYFTTKPLHINVRPDTASDAESDTYASAGSDTEVCTTESVQDQGASDSELRRRRGMAGTSQADQKKAQKQTT